MVSLEGPPTATTDGEIGESRGPNRTTHSAMLQGTRKLGWDCPLLNISYKRILYIQFLSIIYILTTYLTTASCLMSSRIYCHYVSAMWI